MAAGVAATIQKLWRHNRWLTISFALTLTLALVFSIRAGVFFVYWQNHADEPIEGWMTIRYIARSYRVDPKIVHDAIRLPQSGPDRRPLIKIAREEGQTLDALTATILAAIESDRASRGKAGDPQAPATDSTAPQAPEKP